MSSLPTTKFLIQTLGQSRMLTLESNCEKIRLSDVEHIKTDGWLISPVLDEVPETCTGIHKKQSREKKFCDARSTRIYKNGGSFGYD